MCSDHYIFKLALRSNGIDKLVPQNKKLSFTAAKQNIVNFLKTPDLNIGLHSLRSAAANASVNERCLQRHGQWKSVSLYPF